MTSPAGRLRRLLAPWALPASRRRGPRDGGRAAAGRLAEPGSLSAVQVQALLVALHDDAVERVNAAVAEGRLDLVREAVDEHTDAALATMTALRLED